MGSQQIMALLAVMAVCALLLSTGQAAKPMSRQHRYMGETAGYREYNEKHNEENVVRVQRDEEGSQDSAGSRNSEEESQDSAGSRGSDEESQDSAGSRNSEEESQDSAGSRNSEEESQDSAGSRGSEEESQDSIGSRGSEEESQDSIGSRGSEEESQDSIGSRGSEEESQDSVGNRNSDEESQDSAGSRGSDKESEDSAGNRNSEEESQDSIGSRGSEEESQDSVGNRNSNEESQDSAGSRGRDEESQESGGSEEESQDSTESNGSEEESQDSAGSRGSDEESQDSAGSRGREEESQDSTGSDEESQDSAGSRGSDEESHSAGSRNSEEESEDSAGSRGSDEESQESGGSEEESEDSTESRGSEEESQDSAGSRGSDEESQYSGGSRGSEEESQDIAGSRDSELMTTTTGIEVFETTWTSSSCTALETPGLPEGNINDTVTAKCGSGFFEGVWKCQYNSSSGTPQWVEVQCDAPEGLQFAATSELIISNPVEAVDAVLLHVRNATLDFPVASALLERIMTSSLHHPGSYIVDSFAAKATLCDFTATLNELKFLPSSERASIATKLLHALDIFALMCIDSAIGQVLCGTATSARLEVRDVVPGADMVSISVGKNSITLPNVELTNSLGRSSVKAASFFFEDLSDILIDESVLSGHAVSTPVISTALLCGNDICNTSSLDLPRPVKIVLEQQPLSLTKNSTHDRNANLCSYWELYPDIYTPITGSWSQRGCVVNEKESTDGVVVCECSHLTHFAVLLSPGVELEEKHEFALQVIGYIGVVTSLAAMAITVLFNICLKSLWSMRAYIHVNLCLSLMAAQLLFVAAIDKTGNMIACSVVAVLLHYLFLTSFMWMLMEGVVLYVLLVQVFVEGSQKKYIIRFTIASYGLPAVYMCVTVPLGFLLNGEWHYGSEEMCWLRYDTHFIWAFIVPVILILMVNVGFFIMAIVIMRRHQQKKKDSSKLSSIKKWLKTGISLTVVMGLTWISGVAVFHEALLPFAYIFTICVAFQGVAIFVLFVVASKQVREALVVCMKDRVNDSEFLSEHIGSRMEKMTTDSTRIRRESAMQYYRNLRQQRRESELSCGVASTYQNHASIHSCSEASAQSDELRQYPSVATELETIGVEDTTAEDHHQEVADRDECESRSFQMALRENETVSTTFNTHITTETV